MNTRAASQARPNLKGMRQMMTRRALRDVSNQHSSVSKDIGGVCKVNAIVCVIGVFRY